MKVEMEGKEFLYFVFGVPICAVALSLGAHVIIERTKTMQPINITSPEVRVNVPPAEVTIREIKTEVVKVSPVNIENKMPDLKIAEIKIPEINMPEIKMPQINFPEMKFPTIMKVEITKAPKVEITAYEPIGDLLPSPTKK